MDPIPSPSAAIDPFNPLPAEIPPPPDWLLPLSMGIFVVAVLGITTLLVMWGVARRKSAARLAEIRSTNTSSWVDLMDFDPKGDPRRPKSPKVVRDDPRKPKGKKKT